MIANTALAELRAEEHVSVSALKAYIRCPRSYEYRYLLKQPSSHRPAALAFGSAIHSALALFYRRLLDEQSVPTMEELQSAFADSWQREITGELPVLFDKEQTADTVFDQGVALVEVFHREAERPKRVVGVEEAFSIELADPLTGEVLPQRLVGVLDGVLEDGDGFCILEHKTTSRRYSAAQLDHDLQITAYSLAAPVLGLGPAGVTVQFLLKKKEPSLEVCRIRRGDRDHRDLFHVAQGVMVAISAGAFPLSRDWWCHGCPFAEPCLAG